MPFFNMLRRLMRQSNTAEDVAVEAKAPAEPQGSSEQKSKELFGMDAEKAEKAWKTLWPS